MGNLNVEKLLRIKRLLKSRYMRTPSAARYRRCPRSWSIWFRDRHGYWLAPPNPMRFKRLHEQMGDRSMRRVLDRFNWDRFPSWKAGIRGARRHPF